MKKPSLPSVEPHVLSRVELGLVAKALSDPIRLEMADIMAQMRGSCCLPDPTSRGVPGLNEPHGICVCELQDRLGLSQSKVSYHLRVLREAGLIRVETRGKWAFYSLREERLRGLTHAVDRWIEP